MNICDTSVVAYGLFGAVIGHTHNVKKVKIQLPGSGCDEWRGIVLCVVFSPPKPPHSYQLDNRYQYHTRRSEEQKHCDHYIYNLGHSIGVKLEIGSPYHDRCYTRPEFVSEYGEVESHHLWLHTLSKKEFCLPETAGRSIDKKGFHQVELEIHTKRLEVEKIGFRVV